MNTLLKKLALLSFAIMPVLTFSMPVQAQAEVADFGLTYHHHHHRHHHHR